jgi:predicted tellurium resistance membrane protein TerC
MIIEPEIVFSLLTLTLLEIVLGIDNIIFIALLVQKLPPKIAKKARIIGLSLALGMRVVFLLGLSWVMSLTYPIIELHSVFNDAKMVVFSGRDLMFLFGGLFLIFKVTKEIIEEMRVNEHSKEVSFKGGFTSAIIQIVIIDLVFSFDSVITAVGLTSNIPVIIAAMTIAMVAMLFSSEWIAGFIRKNPNIKMLALAFIGLIGAYLVCESLEIHFDKGYIYFAMGFAFVTELLSMLARRRKMGAPATLGALADTTHKKKRGKK